jgi:hypothetical protein
MVFHSLLSFSKRSMISEEVFVSSAPVGSSANINLGEMTRARAIETLCFCPHEISFGILCSFHSKPTFCKASIAL